MGTATKTRFDWPLVIGMTILVAISIVILRSIAPYVFPNYFVYLAIGIVAFIFFSLVSFDILSLFSWHFYAFSIVFLLIPLLIGQVTRGAVRWIPIGSFTLQPAELVRPLLLVFFANFLSKKIPDLKYLLKALGLLAIPLFLILVQPSLGVSVLTFMGFVGVLLSTGVNKKYIIGPLVGGVVCLPLLWFVLAPYQKLRVETFLFPTQHPTGAGYNSLQSMISVGSGKLLGRGLGQGVQTQLLFLPERHTDFIFASVAEELGFLGAIVLMLTLFFVLSRIIKATEDAQSPTARAFCAGVFLTLLVQVVVHIGMNMGLFPITGLPLPLVSAGGSSLIATTTTLGMVVGARKS